MTDIILHHYPQSPVSEKVRVALGIKDATWRSVEIPRLPPKPDLMPLTGGYRRTPVMQIGADIYCDSECILREIDTRLPEPPLFRQTVSLWDPEDLFDLIFRLVLVYTGDAMPEGFVEDRGRLYLGPDWNMDEVSAQIPDAIERIRERFSALDAVFAANVPYLGGETPGASDATAYHLVWFLRGRWAEGPALLDAFPDLNAWEERMTAIGHGKWQDLSSKEALRIAAEAKPLTKACAPSDLIAGQAVSVTPDSDGGDPAVSGALHRLDKHTVAIMRDDPQVGKVCVHFPRTGYLIRRAG